MSVINQMLRDLDARGQGDGAARRAALASVGHPVGHRRTAWRSRGLWWAVAAVTLALAIATVLLVADRWRTLERMGRTERESPASERTQALVEAAAVGQDTPPTMPDHAESTPAPERAATLAGAASSAPIGEASSLKVPAPSAALMPSTAPMPANKVPAPPVATEPTPRPDPAPAAPPALATIERVAPAVDPLDEARRALAEGRAEAALAALAEQPTAGAERDALEAAALQQLGRHAEAEQSYRRALALEPDIGAWWAGLGIALDAGGRGGEALAAFREAQRRGPLDPALADYLGERVEALSAGESPR